VAAQWGAQRHDPLAIVAIACALTPGARAMSIVPGLPDDAYETDGVLTKREVRAVTISALAPLPGQLLWDVGAGSGSISVEWMRTHPSCRAIAVEPRADRRAHIAANAHFLGVPDLIIMAGSAPSVLAGLERPDTIFIGGGVTTDGVVEACVAALVPGARLVANGVTIETEVALAQWQQRLGGQLIRLTVSHAAPLGGFSGFRPTLPITQWTYLK
jgi:precorrin-6B C5,15-methyltransferase / cobalt-precorrin-6B C5,C15-methyltransferase